VSQAANSQPNEGAKNSAVKTTGRKRLRHLLPELRAQVPGLFDRCPAERVAEQFGVPKFDVLEDVVRDLRQRLRKPPASESIRPAHSTLQVVSRRSA